MAKFIKIWDKFGILALIVLMVIVFSIANPKFLSSYTLLNILRQGSVIGVAALGYGMLLISGVISLSTGAMLSFCAVSACALSNAGIPAPVCLLASIVLGAICCMTEGLIGQYLRVGAFLATLGTMNLWTGLATTITGGQTQHVEGSFFEFIGSSKYFGFLPFLSIILLICAVLLTFIMSRTYFGRNIYANGGNESAAYLNGVKVFQVRLLTHAVAGALVGLAAFMLLSRNSLAQGEMGGSVFIDCLTAAVLGGVSFYGGTGKIQNILLGVLALQILNIGMQMVGITSWIIQILKGVLLIFAFCIEYFRERARKAVLISQGKGI